MAITARVTGKAMEEPLEVQFAYPLAAGDKFVLRRDDDLLVCTVEVVLHYPTAAGAAEVPTVGYRVSHVPLETMRKRWWMAKRVALDVLTG